MNPEQALAEVAQGAVVAASSSQAARPASRAPEHARAGDQLVAQGIPRPPMSWARACELISAIFTPCGHDWPCRSRSPSSSPQRCRRRLSVQRKRSACGPTYFGPGKSGVAAAYRAKRLADRALARSGRGSRVRARSLVSLQVMPSGLGREHQARASWRPRPRLVALRARVVQRARVIAGQKRHVLPGGTLILSSRIAEAAA